MAHSRTFLLASALAYGLFAGTANAVPFFPDRDTRPFETTPAQVGSLPTQSRSNHDWQYETAQRGAMLGNSRIFYADSNRTLLSSPWMFPEPRSAQASYGWGNGYSESQHRENERRGWSAFRDLVEFILDHLNRKHEPHYGGGAGAGAGSAETPPAPTPLPAPLVLLSSGLALVGLFVRRRRKPTVAPA